jgi:hypothetical protein
LRKRSPPEPPRGRVSAFTFFSITILLKAACFEEKMHHEVAEVEKGSQKKT